MLAVVGLGQLGAVSPHVLIPGEGQGERGRGMALGSAPVAARPSVPGAACGLYPRAQMRKGRPFRYHQGHSEGIHRLAKLPSGHVAAHQAMEMLLHQFPR
jgi:hypothetical protein